MYDPKIQWSLYDKQLGNEACASGMTSLTEVLYRIGGEEAIYGFEMLIIDRHYYLSEYYIQAGIWKNWNYGQGAIILTKMSDDWQSKFHKYDIDGWQ
jgi:hypothetical protein